VPGNSTYEYIAQTVPDSMNNARKTAVFGISTRLRDHWPQWAIAGNLWNFRHLWPLRRNDPLTSRRYG